MPIEITKDQILKLTRHAVPRIISGIVDNQKRIIDGGIDTPLRLCHFMAQLCHESASFQVTEEFASGKAYEGREDLGNTHKGDGPRYKGRGLIQTTGRANYREASVAIRKIDPAVPNFENEPEKLEDFPWALLAGIIYWQSRNINAAADRDDVVRVTKLVNGGKRGLKERTEFLRIAKTIWMTAPNVGADDPHPTLKRGSHGQDVKILQNELIEAGFAVLADSDFGQHTEDAVKAFQTSRGLPANGIVGKATWDALEG